MDTPPPRKKRITPNTLSFETFCETLSDEFPEGMIESSIRSSSVVPFVENLWQSMFLFAFRATNDTTTLTSLDIEIVLLFTQPHTVDYIAFELNIPKKEVCERLVYCLGTSDINEVNASSFSIRSLVRWAFEEVAWTVRQREQFEMNNNLDSP